jgi:hypothetical protein
MSTRLELHNAANRLELDTSVAAEVELGESA